MNGPLTIRYQLVVTLPHGKLEDAAGDISSPAESQMGEGAAVRASMFSDPYYVPSSII
jgi:hypothetical protein